MLKTVTNEHDRSDLHWVEAATNAAWFASRRRRLTPTEAEELRSEVWLKVLRNDRAVLRQFRGRSSLQSYLIAVADRCALDQQVRELGKWRPSRRTRNFGEAAVRIERLARRDGMSLDEAVRAIHIQGEVPGDVLRAAASVVPPARPRRRTAPLDEALAVACDRGTPEALLETARAAQRAGAIRTALTQCLERLPPDDLHLLTRRFMHGDSVAHIGRTEARDQKGLYRKIDQLCRRLKARLAAFGITAEDVRPLLGCTSSPLESVLAGAACRRASNLASVS